MNDSSPIAGFVNSMREMKTEIQNGCAPFFTHNFPGFFLYRISPIKKSSHVCWGVWDGNFIRKFSKLKANPQPVDRVLSVTVVFPRHVILYFAFWHYATWKYKFLSSCGRTFADSFAEWFTILIWRFEKLHFVYTYFGVNKSRNRGQTPGRTYLNTSLCRTFKLSITRSKYLWCGFFLGFLLI